MSIEVLNNLDQEVRRLFIAGSKLAPGDLRLGKLQPQLRKLGEASPVFARVAQAVEQTMDPKGDRTSEKLLELATLLQSILYTQGQTDTKDEALPLEGKGNLIATHTTFRKLKPVKDALLQKGQGRLEVIREAYEAGVFRDSRLLIPAVTALDEPYFEIPELLEKDIIPAYGDDALPVLEQQLRLDGGKGDARRLRLIHRLLGDIRMSLYVHAASEGSLELRTAAIELLGAYPEQESFLLEQSKDRKKDVRRAALIALAKLGTSQSSARILEALASKDRDSAVEPAAISGDGQLVLRVVDYARNVFTKLRQGQKDEETLEQLGSALKALGGRRLPEVFELLREMLSEETFIVRETWRLQENVLEMLVELNSPEANAFAVSLKAAPHTKFLSYSFRAALQSLPPDEVYDQYAGYLTGSNKKASKMITDVLYSVQPNIYYKLVNSEKDSYIKLDERWVYACIKINEAQLVFNLAHTNDKQTISYLKEICENGSSKDFRRYYTDALLALFYIEYKGAAELVQRIFTPELLSKTYYLNHEHLLLLRMLPASYADWLANLAEDISLPRGMRDSMLEISEEIRKKPIEEMDEGKGWMKWLRDKIR